MGDEMGYTNWMNSLADDTYIQGACCNPMVATDYQNQISELSNYTSLSSLIAKDPYNIPAPVAKADIAGQKLILTTDQRSSSQVLQPCQRRIGVVASVGAGISTKDLPRS